MQSLPTNVAEWLQTLTYGERAVAYLQVDPGLNLIGAGGHLDNYGLETVQLGEPAIEQAYFLEGLLPLSETPYFVPSVELAGGRAADLHFQLYAGAVWVVLLDVTAERNATQRVQQKAYEMTLLQEKEALLNRRLEAANAALLASQRELEASRQALLVAHERLQSELAEAANYVRSLLPAPMSHPFVTEWRFVPSTELGGDAFGYHWVDSDHFAFYLLDVCGHGIGPSLLSVAALHVLQSASLRNIDFRNPAQVLAALNESYQMQSASDLYFTLWYGVYQPASRRLDYGCAGHPPAVLVETGSKRFELLKAKGLPIGLVPGAVYSCETITLPRDRCLYLLSDGAFEVERVDGSLLTFKDFLEVMTGLAADGRLDLDRLYDHLVALRGGQTLEDDFSIMRFAF
jgi:serine phosphatase RsbU (regulator of sigma subunit)